MRMDEIRDKLLIFLMIFIMLHWLVSYIKLINDRRNNFLGEIYPDEKIKRYKTIMRYKYIIKWMLLGMEGVFVSMLFSLCFMDIERNNDTDISVRIENISQDLAESSIELSTIQQELEERIEFVEELKKEAEIAENVISLTDEQVNAVQEKLNEELESSSNQGLVQNIIISTFFFALGIIVQPVINVIKKKNSKESENIIEKTEYKKYSDEEIGQAIKLLDTLSQNRNESAKET